MIMAKIIIILCTKFTLRSVDRSVDRRFSLYDKCVFQKRRGTNQFTPLEASQWNMAIIRELGKGMDSGLHVHSSSIIVRCPYFSFRSLIL